MKRREWLQIAGRAATALSIASFNSSATAENSGAAEVAAAITRLKLRHTWTTTMSSSEYRDTLQVRYTKDGVTGVGEGAPIVRYHENAEGARNALESVRAVVEAGDPWRFRSLMQQVHARIDGQFAAKAAIDIAIMDWVALKLSVPLYRFLGLNPEDTPVTTFSIGIDTPDVTRQKVREAEPFPVLKIKVGLKTDEPTVEAVRSVTNKPLRVDANEGWSDKEEAVRKINWLETQGVQFVEQPMPAAMLEETSWVRKRVHLPLIADEACLNAAAVPKLVDAYDGVNIKLDKCGGILEALRTIEVAKALGMKTMLGCMVSSSVSVTAAAHLSPLVDYADLDGNLLVSNDPYTGVQVRRGKLILPTRPGLGVTPSQTPNQ